MLVISIFCTKICLRFHRWFFILSEKELFSWTYLLKTTPWRKKILISPVWNRILKIWDTIFEFKQIDVQCNKNYFKLLYHKKLKLLEVTWKRNRKSYTQHGTNIYIIYLQIIFALAAIQCKGWPSKNCINSVEKRLKFSYFEVSIIP